MSEAAPKVVGPEAVQAAVDAILGVDPSQAPTKVELLAERLSVPQPGLAGALEMLVGAGQSKHMARFLPTVFTLLEAAGRACPAEWGEVKPKAFVASIAAVTAEARQVIGSNGAEPTVTRTRQPHLAALFDRSFLGDDAPTRNLPLDERLGLYVLLLGTVRAIDRQLLGIEKPVVAAKLPGRNDPCHCGSGTKFKKCHGAA
jgi:hypothetical protein